MTSKEQFLTRIAHQLGRQPWRVPPKREVQGAPDFWQQYTIQNPKERIQRFANEVTQLGGQVSIYPSKSLLREGLRQLLQELQPSSVLAWDEVAFADWQLGTVLEEWQPMSFETGDVKQALQTDVGITAVDYAIADTGTLVICTDQHKMRATSLFPAMHIALVDSSQIKTRMGEVFSQFYEYRGGHAPSSIHFISGPSRSSDIENDLSIGVHGPAALYVLIKESTDQR